MNIGELRRKLAIFSDDCEITVSCLDAEFHIDCVQYIGSHGDESARLTVRIEPDGERQ